MDHAYRGHTGEASNQLRLPPKNYHPRPAADNNPKK